MCSSHSIACTSELLVSEGGVIERGILHWKGIQMTSPDVAWPFMYRSKDGAVKEKGMWTPPDPPHTMDAEGFKKVRRPLRLRHAQYVKNEVQDRKLKVDVQQSAKIRLRKLC